MQGRKAPPHFFLWSAPVAFRRVALETPEWTSRDSNHHRQSVSAGKTNAIPTEPSGRLRKAPPHDREVSQPSPHQLAQHERRYGVLCVFVLVVLLCFVFVSPVASGVAFEAMKALDGKKLVATKVNWYGTCT